MTRLLRFASAALALTLASTAALSAQEGVEAIRQLAGCFEVRYQFAEDGTHGIFSERYGLRNPSTEWVGLQKTATDTFVLQHALVMGASAFAHWHEVWTWNRDTQAWTQEVRAGADRPGSQLRYRCTAPWTRNRWECHAGRAEKPLRDENRAYDWLDRRNILLVTPRGWVHDEHNRKMRAPDELVAYELGWITYTRVDDDRCEAAIRQFPIDAAASRR